AEKRHFIGLPIPAAAEMIAATVLLYYRFGGEGVTHKHFLLLLVTYALAGLMVSSIKYFSFKETELYRRQPFGILIAIIILLKFCIAAPQIMLFATFLCFASSGAMRWLWIRGKRQMRRRGLPFGDGVAALVHGWRGGPEDGEGRRVFGMRSRRSRKHSA